MSRKLRKLWATRYIHPGAEMKRHESQAAAYRWLREEARHWSAGRAQHVRVLLDERLAFGGKTFDQVALLLAAAVVVGAALACTATAIQAAAALPRLETPMQPLAVGQDQHSAFPGITREPSGVLRLVWRQGSDHYLTRDGRIMIAESWDDGETWTNPQTIRANPDYRDPLDRKSVV